MLKKGFSMIELMIGVAILVFALTALLASYANMFLLSDVARDNSIATNAIRSKIEEVKKQSFTSLDAYNGTIFNLDGFSPSDAKGIIEVSNVAGFINLKEIRVVGCFVSRGRVIGEDTNLNGILDVGTGEDVNNNSRLDSPAEIVTLITK
jgi:prepilin-type N-terminal cleavage/methylation domain-containing protein|tara:strand:- start:471 stop:920 length:450 start_codon:yes stop_codon:yes gene_type:complete